MLPNDPVQASAMLTGIQVHESPFLAADSWGHYICGVIVTPNAKRLAANMHNIGIDRKTGALRLLPGKVEVET